jgi:hypothetical protein
VVAVGSDMGDKLAVGDRVCGAALGMNKYNKEAGAFATHVLTEGDVFLRLPDSMSTVQGASLPAGLCTMGLALRKLGLPTPEQPADKPFKVLVYGGSTASGTLVMQLLRLSVHTLKFPSSLRATDVPDRSNLIPIATCSPRNFDLVTDYGAEIAFDYRTPTCAEDIVSVSSLLSHA